MDSKCESTSVSHGATDLNIKQEAEGEALDSFASPDLNIKQEAEGETLDIHGSSNLNIKQEQEADEYVIYGSDDINIKQETTENASGDSSSPAPNQETVTDLRVKQEAEDHASCGRAIHLPTFSCGFKIEVDQAEETNLGSLSPLFSDKGGFLGGSLCTFVYHLLDYHACFSGVPCGVYPINVLGSITFL